MSLGAGIFLLVVGAILTFAVDFDVPGLDLTTIGYILMIAGAVGIVLGIVLMARKRQSVSTTSESVDPVTGARVQRSVRQDGL